MKETDDLEIIFNLGFVALIVWAVWSVIGLFGGGTDTLSSLGASVNSGANSVGNTIRSIFSGGADSTPDQAILDKYNIPEPQFVVTDLLPNWINTATYGIEPEATDPGGLGGVAVTGTW